MKRGKAVEAPVCCDALPLRRRGGPVHSKMNGYPNALYTCICVPSERDRDIVVVGLFFGQS